MSGYVDTFESRRIAFEKCRWWKRKKAIDSNTGREAFDVVCHRILPEGTFRAEEVQAISQSQGESGNVMFTRYSVILSTTDDIWGKLNHGDLVEYKGRIWKVNEVTLNVENRRSQFAKKNTDGAKTISLVS